MVSCRDHFLGFGQLSRTNLWSTMASSLDSESLQRELDEARSELAVNACLRENARLLEQRNRVLAEERDSLQHLLNEALAGDDGFNGGYGGDIRHELVKTRAMLTQASAENAQLRAVINGDDGNKDSPLLNLLSAADATKSLITRKASNLLTLAQADRNNNSNDLNRGHGDDDEHQLMQSTIVSLEEQVSALKQKLRETDALLCEHERRSADLVLNVDSFSTLLNRHFDSPEAASLSLGKLCSANGEVNVKESDVYTTLLITRVALLHSELASAKKLLGSKSLLIDELRGSMKSLRQDALVENEKLLKEQKDNLSFRVHVQSILTPKQKESLAKKYSFDVPKELPKISDDVTQQDDESSSNDPNRGVGVRPPLVAEPSSSSSSSESSSPPLSPSLRIVSASAWESLQSDITYLKSNLLTLASKEELDTIEDLRNSIRELETQNAKLAARESELRSELQAEAEYRKETESKWNEESESHRSETARLNKQTQELEGLLEQLRLAFNVMHEALKKDADSLIKDRENLFKELRREQRENDILMGRHQQKAIEMQNEMIDLPQNIDDVHLMLLKLREELITVKLARERLEEKSRSEIEMLKAQVNHEHSLRVGVEQSKDEDLKMLREQLTHALRRQHQLEDESRSHMSDRQLREQAISDLEKKNEDKSKIERENGDLKARIGILQQELDNSVAVQNDFVRLSQSLQIQLEKIRQAETEVRWQHEDDVDSCNSCRCSLPVNRRKHHCRHCGRIFCSECLDKSVPSGPSQRMAKVCGVCHTLLVQHSAPYFSSQAPNNQ